MKKLSRQTIKGLVVTLSVSTLLVISGCKSSGGSTSYGETGVFQDSPVEGLNYSTPSKVGVTDGAGKFSYQAGEEVRFSLGNLVLGTAVGKDNVTPLDIVAGANGELTPAVVNILRLLQSLDKDGNPSNGIELPVVTQLLSVTSIDFSDEAAVSSVLQVLDGTLTLISADEAIAHFNETLASIDGTVMYIDYLGETRTAPATVGAAEYHTGKGYGKTLFDSADNKCQNCHNELYDTWKSSMHGKSWTDPIFQSKMQDFLRTHINKIGENPTGSKEYTEAMIPKVAQTCIKCHAPGAFYAGDFKANLTVLKSGATTADLEAAKINDQYNLATPTTTFDTTKEAAVVAVSHTNGKLYKLTYQIGHKANQEGINCAFCHSIETPRLMKSGDTYTLKADMRSGPHGPIMRPLSTILVQDDNATSQDMNNFFRLWGPEKPTDYANTNKDADDVTKRASDGRYTMHSIDINGTDGKVHYTGGPFYGPYGVTGKTNENADDETDREAHINPHYDKDNNNHFGESGKGLCLSCHQRSAGAKTSSTHFMELCSTQMAVTTGTDTSTNDSITSPKCQKCHMERIEGTLLHRWADPKTLWTKAVNPGLTSHFDPEDPDGLGDENPVVGEWYNSHAFLGASKTGHKTSVVAKIKSGFSASLNQSVTGDTLTVNTTFMNKTAHMFPGAHPMRRVLTRVIVKDQDGNPINVSSSTGSTTFSSIDNTVTPLSGKVLDATQATTVTVADGGSATLSFPGKSPDLDGSAVTSQKFDMTPVTIPGADYTLASQTVTAGLTQGTVSNAAIAVSSDTSNFTRIYGHETGKMYDFDNEDLDNNVLTGIKETFVVRPGFDSNTVASDTRLSPNETEAYTLTYDITGATGVTVEYRVYYMQKGANGKFLTGADGWLDQALSDSKKLLVTEVYSSGAVIAR